MHRIRGIGGSERHLLVLLPALARLGDDVHFLGLDDPAGDVAPFYDSLRVPAERLLAPRDADPLLAARIARKVRRLRPDIVHTHLVHADVYGALGARMASSRLVSTKHNDDRFRVGPFRYAERAITRMADRVIVITRALRDFNTERVGLPPGKVEVVRYGLDDLPTPWGQNPADPLPADARVLLAVCRLEQQKGLDVAIRALPLLRHGVLVVLGEGPERARLLRLARELRVEERLYLPGRVPDVSAWLRRAALLVHPVRWEGFGLALLEAMLAELPVVASRVSSVPEIVDDGVTGVLVPPDDPAALATALDQILTTPGELGPRGRERARREFSVDRMATRTQAVYRDVSSSA